MAKKIVGYIKIQVLAGKANPSPPIGPALGQRGLNIMEFCKAFNAKTQSYPPETPLPVVITVYGDKTFSFIIKSPLASHMIKEAAGLPKGSSTTGKGGYVGKITAKQVAEIAEKKKADLNSFDISAACKIIEGTARSMGVEVVND